MITVSESLTKLTKSIDNFIDEYKLHFPDDPMSDIWKVKDILCHITYWHRYYMENLKAQVRGKSHILPRLPFYQLNQDGVEKMRRYPDKKLFEILKNANQGLKNVILDKKVKQITYREGTVYEIEKFLDIVNRHIGSHTRGIKKKRHVKIT